MKRGMLIVKNGVIIVAPREGAWIETYSQWAFSTSTRVAPREGAWIETFHITLSPALMATSHPVRVRGLKRHAITVAGPYKTSPTP